MPAASEAKVKKCKNVLEVVENEAKCGRAGGKARE